jgi:hypothetical protein
MHNKAYRGSAYEDLKNESQRLKEKKEVENFLLDKINTKDYIKTILNKYS